MKHITDQTETPFWPDTLETMSKHAHRVNFANIRGNTPFELLGAPYLPTWDTLSNPSILSILTRINRLFQIIGVEVVFKYAYPPSLKYRFISEYVLFQPIDADVLNGDKQRIHYEQLFPNHVETLKEECRDLIKCWTLNIQDKLEPETVPANVYINGERTNAIQRLSLFQTILTPLTLKWCGVEIDQVYINWSKKEATLRCSISFMHLQQATLTSKYTAYFSYHWQESSWQLRSADLAWLDKEQRLRS